MKIPLTIKANPITRHSLFLFILIFCVFVFLVIKDFSRSLSGTGDVEYYEYVGFYFYKNLSLLPFPHLDLINNQAFYPYGTNGVFQPWSIERDIFYSICYSLFGVGAWLQIYYMLSVLITGLGSFFLLFKDYGLARASSAGLVITTFSFYAISKYPDHFSIAVFHWTALSLISDFIITKRITLKQNISLRLILWRACLLVLSLGQELGYIAGCSLASFTISSGCVAFLIYYRYFTDGDINLTILIKSISKNYKIELITYTRTCLLLVALLLVVTFINLPLVLQISKEASKFDFTGVPTGAWWANPLRILMPILPFFYPGKIDSIEQLFHDSPEGFGAGSPGWFLLSISSIGLWQSRKQIIIFIPLLVLLLFCVFYHPIYLPVLKIFPWFSFARVQPRFTVIYPVILCVFALNINLDNLRVYIRKSILVILVVLACTEFYTFYSLKSNSQTHAPLQPDFFQYMEYVRDQPGEAVLDWPFCVVGGNGVGGDSLCPYYAKNGSIFALRRFHNKKVMGQYFGRLHPSQLVPYLEAGWDKLFTPDNQNIFQSSRQTRCFNPEEWKFFSDFYKLNDFAGINLYVDLLPKDCAEDFYTHFEKPVIETKVAGAGTVKFIPKPSNLRSQVDLELGRNLKFEPLLDFSKKIDLLELNQVYGLTIKNLSPIEKNDGDAWRWALSPETSFRFNLPSDKLLSLSFSFANFIQNQDVLIEVNGKALENFSNIDKGTIVKRQLSFKGVSGWNTVVFRYKYWNHQKVGFAPADPRELTVNFTQLQIDNNR